MPGHRPWLRATCTRPESTLEKAHRPRIEIHVTTEAAPNPGTTARPSSSQRPSVASDVVAAISGELRHPGQRPHNVPVLRFNVRTDQPDAHAFPPSRLRTPVRCGPLPHKNRQSPLPPRHLFRGTSLQPLPPLNRPHKHRSVTQIRERPRTQPGPPPRQHFNPQLTAPQALLVRIRNLELTAS